MSDSIHHTLKSVFEGKSHAEIQRMLDEDDPELAELLRKRGIKKRVRDVRHLAALLQNSPGTSGGTEAEDRGREIAARAPAELAVHRSLRG